MRRAVFLIAVGLFALGITFAGGISVSPKKIGIEGASISCRETPFVARVFFPSGSDAVDPACEPVLKELARRIADNPDAIVEIRGYYHIAGDGAAGSPQLATKRAEAVRNRLISYDNSIAKRVLVQPATKPSQCYRGQDGSLDPKIQAENRRAEISVRLSEPAIKKFGTYDPGEIVRALDSSGDLYRFARLVEDNPLFFILITVAGADKIPAAAKIRAKLGKKIKSPAARQRIFIARGDIDANVEIAVSPIWVITKPFRQADVRGELSADAVKISGGDAQIVGVYAGDGCFVAPAANEWNLSKIPDPTRTYFVSGWHTEGAAKRRLWSDEIKFSGWEKGNSVEETMILANYRIDQLSAPEDAGSRANRDLAARQISLIADKLGTPVTVEIAGFTDDTGDPEKNRQMSLFWAQKEFEQIKPLLEYYLGEKIKMDGQNSGRCGNVKIEIVGKSSADENPKIKEDTPAGRIAKRRVEIRIYQ